MWHVSSRSGVANCYTLVTLLTYVCTSNTPHRALVQPSDRPIQRATDNDATGTPVSIRATGSRYDVIGDVTPSGRRASDDVAASRRRNAGGTLRTQHGGGGQCTHTHAPHIGRNEHRQHNARHELTALVSSLSHCTQYID